MKTRTLTQKISSGALMLAFAGLIMGLGAGTTYAASDNQEDMMIKMESMSDEDRMERREMMKERAGAIKDAIENGNYEAFMEAVGEKGRLAELDEESFSMLAEAHKLRMNGEYEAAKEIMQKVDIVGPHKMMKKMKMKRFMNHHEISDEDKEMLRKAHQMFKDGDREEAKEMIQEIMSKYRDSEKMEENENKMKFNPFKMFKKS